MNNSTNPSRRSAIRRTLHTAAAIQLMPHVSFAATAGAAPIRIAQIGTSHAHATKLSVYRESPDYEVIGIVEPDPQRQRQAQAQTAFKGLPFLGLDAVLDDASIQAVLVETEVRDLLKAAQACIDAGKHVHLDKPAGESLADYHRLLRAAERQKLLVQMGYMYRYNPAVLLLRDLLKQDALGQIFEVHAVMSKVVPQRNRQKLAEYPGGIMFELGCHIIDLVVGILGTPAAITAFPRKSTSVDDSLVDNMLAVFEYETATASVRSSAIEVDGGARRHLTVCGTQGTFHMQPLDNPSVRMTLSAPRGSYRKGYQDVSFPRYSRYVGDAADMARVIRGEKTSDYSYQHDLDVQSAVLKASGLNAE